MRSKFISDNILFITKLCVPIVDTTNEYEEKDIEQSINNFILTIYITICR